jgi:hypothetical protein
LLMAWLILVICRFRLALMKHPGFMWYEPVYLSYKLIRICSSCRNHNPVLSSFCFYHRVCQMCNTTGSHMWSSFPVFSGVPVSRSLVLCVMFCRSLLVLLSFFFWPSCCLSFFYLRFLITPLVSSNILAEMLTLK